MNMDNTANRTIASEAWDKLVRLNDVTSEMIRYGSRHYEKHREELNKQRTRILAWIFAAAFCSIIAGVLFCTKCYFIAVLCTGGLAGCLYKVFSLRPVRVIKQLMSAVPNYKHNPFI